MNDDDEPSPPGRLTGEVGAGGDGRGSTHIPSRSRVGLPRVVGLILLRPPPYGSPVFYAHNGALVRCVDRLCQSAGKSEPREPSIKSC